MCMEFKESLKRYLDDNFIDDLLNSMNKERTNCLILNEYKMLSEDFIKLFPLVKQHEIIKNAFYYDPKIYDFGKSFYFDNGLFYIMDPASMLVSHYLPFNYYDNVLDLCAAPGGKTISSSYKDNTINIIANDINYKRALTLSSNIEKCGLSNVIVTSNNIDVFVKKYKNAFDKIILDAPCSGSAMFRKSDEMEEDWTYQKVLKCVEIQKELLQKASLLLKEGGIISYSTCSFSYEEDEEIILDFLKNNPNFHTIKIEENPKFYRSKDLPDAIHLFPNLYEGEGQFICLLQKDGVLKPNKRESFKDRYGYGFINYDKNNDFLYGYNNQLDLSYLTVLRKGVHLFTIKGSDFIPSFHLAHYSKCVDTIELNDDELKLYLHGDSFQKDLDLLNGFYIVSYNKVNLGYVHYINKTLKNLYPKGLRH